MTREDRLAELLEIWEETMTHGRTATPEDLCRDCPDLLHDFRKLLNQLGAVNAVLAGNTNASPEELMARVEAGRYRPLAFHAQGGLGVVFVAEDEELRRNVALKCMQDLAATDPDARTRFLLEAEITSKLEHPGVVPVHGFGRDAHGKPYYAMRFVHGNTLADAIERFHKNTDKLDASERNVERRGLIRRFVAVCETMAYAHARGVIHRDLKPSNIMLGAYGETLVVDWGLAKRLEQANEEPSDPALMPLKLLLQESGRTVLGDVRGSPAFMSPEQARGVWRHVGTASDVYSLGATLYVLLTGQKPYDGCSAMQIMDKVKRGTFPAPRNINGSVPKPLDAICRKAMAFDPAARYVGAAELARDLERWLADEPVTAWREPLTLRARRWLRHHQTLATTTAVTFLVAFVIVGIAGFWLDQKNKQLNQANKTLDQQNIELTRAKATLEQTNTRLEEQKREVEKKNIELTQAKAAVEERKQEVERQNIELADLNKKEKRARLIADTNLLRNYESISAWLQYTHGSPYLEQFKSDAGYQKFLTDLTQQTEEMLSENADNPAALQFCARLHFEMAFMEPQPGLTGAARKHLELAQRRYEQKLQIKSDDPMHVGRLGFTHIERARRLAADKDYPAATKEYLAAFDLHLPYARTATDIDGGQNATGLFVICLSLVQIAADVNMPSVETLLEHIDKALAVLDPGEGDRVNLAQRTYFAAKLRKLQSELLHKNGEKEQSIAVLERILADTEKPPANDAYAYDRALLRSQTFVGLASAEWERGNRDASFPRMESGYRALRVAVEKFPQRAGQDELERIPVAFAAIAHWKASMLDPKEPGQQKERQRAIADGLDALDWIERMLAVRKLTLSMDVRTSVAEFRKQLEALPK